MFETNSSNYILIRNTLYNDIYDYLIFKKLIIIKEIE